ncbi:hypothetical protein [Sphingomonas sp.]|uniref:hypothetical protein n=1 Tax=Sphingomonas sp. TaxID=28214 RepID=UPI003AFFB8AC
MHQLALPVTLLSLIAPIAIAADAEPRGSEVQVAQLTIRERIIIRVPRMPLPPPSAARSLLPRPIVWRERRGPKCIPAQGMAGALVSAPNQVDLVLVGGRRVRAKLDGDCRPLDFYSGFYVRPGGDGMICAGRDAIRVRSGAACEIDRFRALQAAN